MSCSMYLICIIQAEAVEKGLHTPLDLIGRCGDWKKGDWN